MTTVARPFLISPTRQALAALARGDTAGLMQAFNNDPAALAQFAIETRRQNVATLGAHDAFVRRTANGAIRQIIRPVKLSTKDGTLYQIGGGTKKRPVDPETGRWIGKCDVQEWQNKNGRRVRWEEVEVPTDGPAILTHEGLQRCNEVVGASIVSPPTVVVDGERRTNPYVDRAPSKTGLGDVRRIVLCTSVVGFAPATGNPVVVNYTLDYDPAKELAHMLAKIADDSPEDCYLTTEAEAEAERQGDNGRTRWQFHSLYAGVGYFYDLRLDAVRRAYREFIQILAFATRKAQTVCLRNAMKRHPAFSRHHAITDDRGEAIIPVIGWTSEGDALDQVQRIGEALRRGDTGLDDVEAQVVDVDEVYEPEGDADAEAAAQRVLSPPQEEAGGSLLDQVSVAREDREAQLAEAVPVQSAIPGTSTKGKPVAEAGGAHRRNVLLDKVAQGMDYLTAEQARSLPDPTTLDEDALRGVLTQINTMLDAQEGGDQ